jgi:hypothetical protein
MSGLGYWVYLGSRSQAVFTWWSPWHWLWVVFARGDLGRRYQDFLLEPGGQLEQILLKHAWRGRFAARPEPGKGVSCLVVSPEDMVELEAV